MINKRRFGRRKSDIIIRIIMCVNLILDLAFGILIITSL
jgi:hypothetical protein